VLEAWAGYEAEEPEIGIRVLQLLLYGHAHLHDKQPGWELEGRIRQLLADRAGFDVSAKDALYTLDRCAGALYQADVALVRNREATTYFRGADREVLRRPVEYYRCLVNLGANQICNGLYAEAIDTYEEVDALAESYVADVFPRLDYPRMNRLLAELRLGEIEPTEAARRQQSIVIGSGVESDPFYTGNALAVFRALSEDVDTAVEELDALDAELHRTRREPEPGMVYLIRSNRALARYVAGETTTAQSEWTELASAVERTVYPSRPIYVRRHQLLAELIGDAQQMTAAEVDTALLKRYPDEFGPLWDSYGRGFTLPAIEFWREN